MRLNINTSIAMQFVTLIFIVGLSGCAAPLVAFIPAIAGGGVMASNAIGNSKDNEVVVTIDNMPESVKSTLQSAKVLAIVTSDKAGITAAELFESRGGYRVIIDRQTAAIGEISNSERHHALSNICESKPVEVALLSRSTKSEVGSMGMMFLTSRMDLKQTWVVELLTCKSKAYDSFGGTLSINTPQFNADQKMQLDTMIGVAMAKKVLESLGRMSDHDLNQAGKVANDLPSINPSVSPTLNTNSNQTSKNALPAKPVSKIDIQNRLISLGYNIGVADGVFGKKTYDGIKQFQRERKLKETGMTDDETVSALFRPAEK